MGEVVQTLRQVLHRNSFSRVWAFNLPAAVLTNSTARMAFNRMPRWPGFDPLGTDIVTSAFGPGSVPYELTALHPLCWVSSAFVGYRGSVNWTMMPTLGLTSTFFQAWEIS